MPKLGRATVVIRVILVFFAMASAACVLLLLLLGLIVGTHADDRTVTMKMFSTADCSGDPTLMEYILTESGNQNCLKLGTTSMKSVTTCASGIITDMTSECNSTDCSSDCSEAVKETATSAEWEKDRADMLSGSACETAEGGASVKTSISGTMPKNPCTPVGGASGAQAGHGDPYGDPPCCSCALYYGDPSLIAKVTLLDASVWLFPIGFDRFYRKCSITFLLL